MEKLLGKEFFNRIFAYGNITEIRIRKNHYIYIKAGGKVVKTDIFADEKFVERAFLIAVKNSVYSYEEELTRGFVPYGNGIRIGVAGKGKIIKERSVYTEVDSLAIRIPHEIKSAAEPLNFLINNFCNTIIISPPSAGKTTLLRDMVRRLSTYYDVVLIDERNEISGGNLDVGERTDVISGLPKNYCFENIIRSLAPEIVAVDEIMGEKDSVVLQKIHYSGIKVLATIHGDSINEIKNGSLSKVFCKYVLLSSIPIVGSIKSIE